LGFALFLIGVALILVELLLPTLYFLPLGVALAVSGLALHFGAGFLPSLLSFFVLTIFGYYISLRHVRKLRGTRSVLEELQRQEGIVIGRLDEFTYEVRFPLGAAGEEVWNAYSEEELSYGDRVRVVGIKGNKLVVEKVK